MTNNLWKDFKLKFLGGNPVVIYITLSIVIFLLVQLPPLGSTAMNYLAFPGASALWLSRFYTIVTYQFFHVQFLMLLFNMIWLYWMGQLLLDFIKVRQFHFIFLGGGVFSALIYGLVLTLFPALGSTGGSFLIGSNAALMAILVAAATLIPNYSVQLMLFGFVRIKFIVLVYALLDIVNALSIDQASGLAHAAGALFGFAFIQLLQNGKDLSSIFKKKSKLKVVKNSSPRTRTNAVVNQQEVDAVLDKISKTGYDKLTKDEKEILFRASNN